MCEALGDLGRSIAPTESRLAARAGDLRGVRDGLGLTGAMWAGL